MRVWPGRPYPLGATWNGAGANFALFSEHATKVELCLFDGPDDAREAQRIEMTECTDQVWHCYLPDAIPGQLYGYRVHGPYDPEHGHRFNANKVVLDPYAKMLGRDVRWDDSLFGYTIGQDDLSFDERDSAAFAPLASLVDTAFTWGDDRRPRTPWHKTFIYEMHVKGFTMQHPGVAENLRGTYAGLATDAVIRHPARPERHRHRAAAGPPEPQRPAPDREGLVELLGLQHAQLLRPAAQLRRAEDRPQPGPRVQNDGAGHARGRHRGHP